MPRLESFEDLWDGNETAAYLHISRSALYHWNYKGIGPRPIHMPNKRVYYKRDEVRHFLAATIKASR